MLKTRLIPRLDVKDDKLIKGIHLEGVRVIGDPLEYATRYADQGADELLLIDTVASLYGRNNLANIIERAVDQVFIPVTAGGGIRSIQDVKTLLRAGADKITLNTAAIADPTLISRLADKFGSQCIVLSIEAKHRESGWEAYTDNGREHTGRDVLTWVQEAVALGAGEILLTSIDQEGTRKGYDLDLIRAVSNAVSVPIIASGGMGQPSHMVDAIRAGADAAAMADILHYGRASLADLRATANSAGIPVRNINGPFECNPPSMPSSTN